MGDDCVSSDPYPSELNQARNRYANLAYGGPRRVPTEARTALAHVLSAMNDDVSLEALERAVATVKAHLEADA